MTAVYRSKVDTWLVVVLIAAATVAAISCAVAIPVPDADDEFWILTTLVFAIGFPIWIFASTDYTLTDTALDIRSGPFRWSIPFADITALVPTRNPLSSPALSLDRLRVESGSHKSIMISPRDRDEFIREVEARRAAARAAAK